MIAWPAFSIAAALSTPIVAPCQPPVAMPMRLHVTRSLWLPDGRAGTVTVERRLVFRDMGDGMIIEARLLAVRADPASAAHRARMTAAFGRAGEAPMRFLLDPLFRVRAIDGGDAHWDRYVARQQALRNAMAKAGEPTARADAMLAMLGAMPTADRVRLLSASIAPVLSHCGTALPPDAVAQDDGAVHFVEAMQAAGTASRDTYRIDRSTGLLRVLDRTVAMDAAPLRPLKEYWTLAREAQ